MDASAAQTEEREMAVGEEAGERLDIVPAQFRVSVVRRPNICLPILRERGDAAACPESGSSRVVCRLRPPSSGLFPRTHPYSDCPASCELRISVSFRQHQIFLFSGKLPERGVHLEVLRIVCFGGRINEISSR